MSFSRIWSFVDIGCAVKWHIFSLEAPFGNWIQACAGIPGADQRSLGMLTLLQRTAPNFCYLLSAAEITQICACKVAVIRPRLKKPITYSWYISKLQASIHPTFPLSQKFLRRWLWLFYLQRCFLLCYSQMLQSVVALHRVMYLDQYTLHGLLRKSNFRTRHWFSLLCRWHPVVPFYEARAKQASSHTTKLEILVPRAQQLPQGPGVGAD